MASTDVLHVSCTDGRSMCVRMREAVHRDNRLSNRSSDLHQHVFSFICRNLDARVAPAVSDFHLLPLLNELFKRQEMGFARVIKRGAGKELEKCQGSE